MGIASTNGSAWGGATVARQHTANALAGPKVAAPVRYADSLALTAKAAATGHDENRDKPSWRAQLSNFWMQAKPALIGFGIGLVIITALSLL